MSYAGAMTVARNIRNMPIRSLPPRKLAFLAGDDQAYIAGIIAVLIGAVLVFFLFPKLDNERKMLVEYHQQDMAEWQLQLLPKLRWRLEQISSV